MKPSDDFREIGEWLRSHKPEIAAPPTLETRIVLAIRDDPQSKPRALGPWIWWLLPPVAACLLLLLPQQGQTEPTVETQAEVSADAASTSSLLGKTSDPLLAESEALGRDVQRASGFLIHCLPSFSSQAP
jgi:hypothetical protein